MLGFRFESASTARRRETALRTSLEEIHERDVSLRLERLRAELTVVHAQYIEKLTEALEHAWESRVRHAETQRVAAQRGLVPYVRGLEKFAKWLKETPNATPGMVAAKLTKLGLWDVRVGYDPDEDPEALAAIAKAVG
jgi:hypothetical protein